MTDPAQSERKVWYCDACQSWTNEAVTREELLTTWGWEADQEDPDASQYCPECV